MHDLIEAIKREDHTLDYLLNRVTMFYNISKDFKNILEPIFTKAVELVSPHHKEMVEIGEMSAFSRYYYTVDMTVDKFTECLRQENFSKDEIGLHQLYMRSASDLFEMERTKYLYQAYNRVLTDKLGLLNYDYNH